MDEEISNSANGVTNNPVAQPLPQNPVQTGNNPVESSSDISGQNFAPNPISVPQTTPSKKSKLPLIVGIVLGIAIIIGIALLLVLKPFDKKDSDSSPITLMEGETDITDETTKTKLQSLVGILFGDLSGSQSIIVRDINYPDVGLFNDGSLSVMSSINVAIGSIPIEQFTTLPSEYYESAKAMLGTDFDPSNIKMISGETAAKRFEQIFGYNLPKNVDMPIRYYYNAENDFYFYQPDDDEVFNSNARYYYQSRFTQTEDNAYVYVSAAFLDPEADKIYCGVYNPYRAKSKVPSLCALASNYKTDDSDSYSFKLDESNYKNYSMDRFEFLKTEDGEFVFQKTTSVQTK